MTSERPVPIETFDLLMGDGAVIRVRRHGRPDGVRLLVSNGSGFAIDGYHPFWGPLAERFEVIAFATEREARGTQASSRT